jgi:hypothetical protein
VDAVRGLRGRAHEEPGDLLGAVDRVAGGLDEAAAVGDQDGLGVEEGDQPVEVSRASGLRECLDDGAVGFGIDVEAGFALLDVPAGAAGELAAARGAAAEGGADFFEGEAEDVVEHEGGAFGRAQGLQDDEHRPGHGVGEAHRIGGVGAGLDRFGEPGADVGLAAGAGGAEDVEGEAGGRGDEPAGEVFDLLDVGALEADPGVLDRILGLGDGAEEAVGDADQAGP